MRLLLPRPIRAALPVAALAALLAAQAVPPVTERDTSSIDILVGKLNPADQGAERFVRATGGEVLRHLSVIDGFSARLPRHALPALSSLPGVRFATPNSALHVLGQYGQNSGSVSAIYSDVVGASRVWAEGTTGEGANVAVLDTGVDVTGDLAGQVVEAVDFTGEQDDQDSYGHGTFVAGLVAGTGAASNGAVKGVAPGSKVVALKIAGIAGTTDVTMVLEALEWLVMFRDTYDVKVLNLSLGFDSTQSYLVDPLDFAIERVWAAGITVVAASGNTAGFVSAPGNDPMVVTVGASSDQTTTSLADDTVPVWSGGGVTVDGIQKPEVWAPGRGVVSSRSPGSTLDGLYPGNAIGASYAKGSGTSYATAVVSGIAALILSRTPSLTPDQVKARLMATSRGFGLTQHPGLVDAYGAVMSTSTASANAGVTPGAGTGSLQLTRGTSCLRDTAGLCLSDADADALLGFDSAGYFGGTWAGTQWTGTQWTGTQWTGTQWTGTQWTGTQWTGTQWTGTQWTGTQWTGTQWTGTDWTDTDPDLAPSTPWSFAPGE